MTNWDQQYCPTCGAGQVPDAYFCGNCGTSFQPAEPNYTQLAPSTPYQPSPSDPTPYQPAEPAHPYEDTYPYDDGQPGEPAVYADYQGYEDYPADPPTDRGRSAPLLPEPLPEAEVELEDPRGSDETRPVRTQRGPAPLLVFTGILIAAVTAASPTLLAADDNDSEEEATPAAAVDPAEVAEDEVLLQAADQVPVGAFFPDEALDRAQADDAETDLADLVVRVVSLPEHPTTRDEANASLSELTVTGTDDGVYSGQRGTEVCDRNGLAALVAGESTDEESEGEGEGEGSTEDDEGSAEEQESPPTASVAEQFATALELDSAEAAGEYVDGLTAVRLRLDTRVTQHNLVDGTVVPIQTILQAGTGVLVDETGLARVSCNGGNPLGAPTAPEDGDTEAALEVDQVAVNHAEAWERLDPSRVVTVEPGTEPLEQVLFADIDSTDLVERPVGTNGGRDMGPGDFVATLEWDAPADLDISVVDPNEATISSQLAEPPNSNGRLAEDANTQCQDNMVGREEISWPDGDAPEGDYLVRVTGHAVGEGPSDNQDVDYEHDCGSENAEFKLTIRLYGQDPVVHEESVADKETKEYTVSVGGAPAEAPDADRSEDSAGSEPEDS